MKKITAILTAVLILTFSMFSVSAFAQETEQFDVSQTRLAQWSEKANANKEFEVKMKKIHEDGSVTEGRLFLKKDCAAVEGSLNGHPFRMIENSKGKFLYFTNFPILYFKADNLFSESFVFTYGIKETHQYVKSYEESGYYVEEFYDTEGDRTILYYFQGEDLKLSKSSDSVNEYVSTKVDDKDVRLPSFCIDATPLFLIVLLLLNV